MLGGQGFPATDPLHTLLATMVKPTPLTGAGLPPTTDQQRMFGVSGIGTGTMVEPPAFNASTADPTPSDPLHVALAHLLKPLTIAKTASDPSLDPFQLGIQRSLGTA